MINVTFYNSTSGVITRLAVLDKALVDLNLWDGEAWLEGHFDKNTKMIVDGSVVDIPASEIEQREMQAAWNDLRQERTARLSASDWTQVPDAQVDRLAWATYRQALRDIPANTQDPRSVAWPVPPS